MRAALYFRVSTLDQTTDNQERELRAAAERLGHEIVEVYSDNGISGSKGVTGGRRSTACAATPSGAASTSSWRGRSTAWGAVCRTWSPS